MILIVDNYDSFVYNLARYVGELGASTVVKRNDALSVSDIEALRPTHIILSPGPCTPAEAGVSIDVVRELGGRIPVLGVCLGHQAIGAAYGAKIVRGEVPMHGRSAEIRHDGSGVLTGLPSPFLAGRYHSLVIDPATLPADLEVNAWSREGEIMGVRHRRLPVHGVQFHPESILTEHGKDIVNAFMQLIPVSHPG